MAISGSSRDVSICESERGAGISSGDRSINAGMEIIPRQSRLPPVLHVLCSSPQPPSRCWMGLQLPERCTFAAWQRSMNYRVSEAPTHPTHPGFPSLPFPAAPELKAGPGRAQGAPGRSLHPLQPKNPSCPFLHLHQISVPLLVFSPSASFSRSFPSL